MGKLIGQAQVLPPPLPLPLTLGLSLPLLLQPFLCLRVHSIPDLIDGGHNEDHACQNPSVKCSTHTPIFSKTAAKATPAVGDW